MCRGGSAGEKVEAYYADPHMWDRDPHGGLSIAGSYIRAGLRVVPGNNNKDQGWNAVHALLQVPKEGETPLWPRLRLLPTQRKSIEEYYAYSWVPESERTGKGGDKDLDVNDHIMDCRRYVGIHEAPRPLVTQPARALLDGLTGFPINLVGLR